MANTTTIVNIFASGQQLRVGFKTVLTGSYTQVTGETVNLATALQDPTFIGQTAVIPSEGPPISGDIWLTGGSNANGDIVNFLAYKLGTTVAAAFTSIRIITATGTEIAAGAYSATLLADVLYGEIVFNKNI